MPVRTDESEIAVVVGRESLLTADFDDYVGHVETQRVTLPPGLSVPRHSHPGGAVGYVVEGEIVFQPEGHERQRLRVGDTFYERPGATISHFANASSSAPAVFVAFYALTGDQALIEIEPRQDDTD
jgi:quercetin dioxygenase-like cupin family protein